VVVREWGAEDGRPLLFWHGLNPFGALQLSEAGPAWAQRGFRVLAPSAPGLGESSAFSDLDDYRLTRLSDLVVELADRFGLARFDFVGWSWGASIGMHLAARHVVRLSSLVLLDAGHTDVQDVSEWKESSLEERISEFASRAESYESWDAVLEFARDRATDWRPALEERLRAGLEERDGRIVARADLAAGAAALHWVGIERPSTQLSRLGELDLPILLLVATRNDTTRQVDRFRAAIPRATIVEIDSEHDLLAHARDDTIETVADWLLAPAQPRVA
jgi:pimeloyl-ACP methyl ester carboxylesterase